MKPERKPAVRSGNYGLFLTAGIQLAAGIILFLFAGYWLDQKISTTPWLTISGAFLGTAGGMIKFIRTAIEEGRRQDSEDGSSETSEK